MSWRFDQAVKAKALAKKCWSRVTDAECKVQQWCNNGVLANRGLLKSSECGRCSGDAGTNPDK